MTVTNAMTAEQNDRNPPPVDWQRADWANDPRTPMWGGIVGELNAREQWSGAGAVNSINLGRACLSTFVRLFEATGDEPSVARVITAAVENTANRTQAAGDARELIAELRRLSSLTWEQIATIMQASRRTIHNWAAGKPISGGHREQLSRLVATLRYIDRGIGAMNRELLFSRTRDGQTAFDLLIDKRFDDVQTICGEGQGRVARAWAPVDRAALEKYARPSLRTQMEQWTSVEGKGADEPELLGNHSPDAPKKVARQPMKLRRRE